VDWEILSAEPLNEDQRYGEKTARCWPSLPALIHALMVSQTIKLVAVSGKTTRYLAQDSGIDACNTFYSRASR
jgi:hypothetical protein